MMEARTSGLFLVMALDLDDSVQVFGVYASEEIAEAAIVEFEKIHWRFCEWRVQAWKPAMNLGR